MMGTRSLADVLLALVLGISVALIPTLLAADQTYKYARVGRAQTPLDDYIARPEPLYGWTVFENTTERENYTIFYLNMTSQEWMDASFSDTVVWWHYLAIAIPKNIRFTDTSLLFIGGGNNFDDNIPYPWRDGITGAIGRMAEDTGTVCVYFKQVPNQPIVFVNDPEQKERYEDDMIAFTWRTFIDDPSNPNVLARLPMTKAVVKGMDAITEFVLTMEPSVNISKYFVCGPSKRGWTTWTTAAVDTRVIAQAPMVLTSLQFVPNLHHHYTAYGGWSFALEPYYELNLTKDIDNPNTQLMMDIVDPYSYIDRYTMPTIVISATEDQFFLPDDSYFFFSDLPGQKFMLSLRNTEHSLVPYVHVYDYTRAFYMGILTNYVFPVVDWIVTQDSTGGTTTFVSDVTPSDVYAYVADSVDGTRRDFRANQGEDADFVNITWTREPVQDLGGNQYSVSFDNPEEQGIFRIFLIQAEYPGPEGLTLTLTSEVNIVPNIFPFPDCSGTACYGTLL